MRGAIASSSGSATCTGVATERKLSAISSSASIASRFARTADANPSEFVVRQAGGFRESAEGEGEDVVADEGRRCVAEREGMEDFVGDDRQAEARDRILLGCS